MIWSPNSGTSDLPAGKRVDLRRIESPGFDIAQRLIEDAALPRPLRLFENISGGVSSSTLELTPT